MAAHLADRGAALLANHGLVTCAATPEKALHNAALVERTAKIVWGARAMGATIHPLPDKVNHRHGRRLPLHPGQPLTMFDAVVASGRRRRRSTSRFPARPRSVPSSTSSSS